MTKREYAEAIVRMIGGKVMEVEKANGIVLTGINRGNKNSNLSPTVYIDEMYDKDMRVELAAQKVDAILCENAKQENIDIDMITNWAWAKDKLKARLYGEDTKADIFIYANDYGMDDLKIIPYLDMTDIVPNGYIKVTHSLITAWGVKGEEVINTAIKNIEGTEVVEDMVTMMKDILRRNGMPEEHIEMMVKESQIPMLTVTNKDKCFGAITIIAAKEKIKEIYPDGYIILPSSVHEVIVVPYDESVDMDDIERNIVDINLTQVDPEERLGNHAYIIK